MRLASGQVSQHRPHAPDPVRERTKPT
jgi:hypothetical protein